MTRYTFILPAYKSLYIKEMLNSITAQTFIDFKVIISDDCSPDNIKEICEPYLNDRRFIYRKNEKNIGGRDLVEHWNLLVNMCDTEYLIMASDDDIYNEKFLESINLLANRYPHANLLRARACRISHKGEIYAKDPLYEEYNRPIDFIYNTFRSDHIHCIGNYVFKTEELRKHNGFVKFPLAWFSDDATALSCCLNGVPNTHEILFSFRTSQINISNDTKWNKDIAKKKIEATCSFYEWMGTYIEQIKYHKSLYNKYLYKKIRTGYTDRVLWQIDSYYNQIDFKSFIHLIKWMRNKKLLTTNKSIALFIKNWITKRLK